MNINIDTGVVSEDKPNESTTSKFKILKFKDMEVGTETTTAVGVLGSEIKIARNNKPFLALTITDGNETVFAKKWDHTSQVIPQIGDIIDVKLQIGTYNDQKDYTIKGFRANGYYTFQDFRKQSPMNINDLMEFLNLYIGKIQDVHLRFVVTQAFEYHKDDILELPAAKEHHHAYSGGWLQHTIETTQIAVGSIHGYKSFNPNLKIDLDLIVAGALLHDFGKLYAYKWNGLAIEMTDEGKLLDHIVLGLLELDKFAGLTMGDKKKLLKLQHIIASHHHKREWGSPVVPMFIESYIVSQSDYISCNLAKWSEEQDKGILWSPYNNNFGCYPYNHCHDEA